MTEGKRTEPAYLTRFSQVMKATGVAIHAARVVGAGVDPEGVVREAIRIKDDSSMGRFDACWCVVDVDEHSRLPGALVLAQQHQINVAVSNPCFEIWLLWHHEEQTAHASATDLRRRLRRHGHEGKDLPVRFPYHLYPDALQRADLSARDLEPCALGPNPSTSVAALIRAILGG